MQKGEAAKIGIEAPANVRVLRNHANPANPAADFSVASNPEFHLLAGDIAYADPSGGGKPLSFVPSGGKAAKGFDKYNPFVWDVYLGSIEASAASRFSRISSLTPRSRWPDARSSPRVRGRVSGEVTSPRYDCRSPQALGTSLPMRDAIGHLAGESI